LSKTKNGENVNQFKKPNIFYKIVLNHGTVSEDYQLTAS